MEKFAVFLLLFASSSVFSQSHVHPAIPGDFADPSVILVKGTYYAIGTSSEWAPHFPIFKSTDLKRWTAAGSAFKNKPSWTSSSFWAPELFYYKDKFLLYYVARRASDNVSCIGLAVADDPGKGFRDFGPIIETGKEAIDPFVFEDGNELYISWKAYGLDERPIELLAAKLSRDGKSLLETPVTLLRDDDRKGLEGQSLIRHGQYYYLFYSTGNCCGSACTYHVEVARSESVKGPYTRYGSNPLLDEFGDWKCPGHGTLVKSTRGSYHYLFHAYHKDDHVFTGRQAILADVTWHSGWPVLTPVSGAEPDTTWTDNFDSELLSAWQWDFRNGSPVMVTGKGELCLSGSGDTVKNATGRFLGIRPQRANYTATVELTRHGRSLTGIAAYGDAGASVGLGIAGEELQLWKVEAGRKVILTSARLADSGKIQFRMITSAVSRLRFYWKTEHSVWQELTGDSGIDGSFLPQWDRSPRVGLQWSGPPDDRTCYSFFTIEYP